VEKLFCQLSETERETLSTRGTSTSWAVVMVRYPKLEARMLSCSSRFESKAAVSEKVIRGMKQD
jgi:hypothetical protein